MPARNRNVASAEYQPPVAVAPTGAAGVQWQDPGPAQKGPRGTQHQAFFDALEANPGQWAVWPGGSSRSWLVKLPNLQVTQRTMGGQHVLYVRYVTPGDSNGVQEDEVQEG